VYEALINKAKNREKLNPISDETRQKMSKSKRKEQYATN